jgi:transposase
MQIRLVGIDLGKTTFHLVALGASGRVLVKKKFTQKQLLAFTANMQTSLIDLEACSGAHFLGQALRKQGHDVRLGTRSASIGDLALVEIEQLLDSLD